MHTPVSIRHARLTTFVQILLNQYVERRALGELFRETTAVKLSSRNVFLPDLAFYRRERLNLLHDTYINGAPDLVVEVLSPRTGERDIGVKFAEYEQHGVGEYWVLDPETLAHRFYAREGELLVEFANGEELIPSRVVDGFFLRRAWLDPAGLPATADCLRELTRRTARTRESR
jgi:Uma2 family endonuclease